MSIPMSQNMSDGGRSCFQTDRTTEKLRDGNQVIEASYRSLKKNIHEKATLIRGPFFQGKIHISEFRMFTIEFESKFYNFTILCKT